MAVKEKFRGVRLVDLRIEDVSWSDEVVHHLRTRTLRYGPGETDLEPEWATEAVFDPWRRLFVPNTGSSLGLIGWSASARLVLRIWLQPVDLSAGVWAGASAAKVKASITNRYWKERRDDEAQGLGHDPAGGG